jgi:hypothetical protein
MPIWAMRPINHPHGTGLTLTQLPALPALAGTVHRMYVDVVLSERMSVDAFILDALRNRMMPVSLYGVLSVGLGSPHIQMRWVTAGWVVAVMAGHLLVVGIPAKRLPSRNPEDPAVCQDTSAIYVEAPVAPLEAIPCPGVARLGAARPVHLSQKSL